jgi:hypothetical protein
MNTLDYLFTVFDKKTITWSQIFCHQIFFKFAAGRKNIKIILIEKYSCCQWLIAQLRSLSVMKDPGSNLGTDICLLRY